MFKTMLLVGVASVLAISAAQAADFEPSPAAFDWTGFYLGLHAGYGWGESDTDSPLAIAGAIASHDVDGFIGGVHGGYNFQADSLVVGLEGDFDFSDVDGDGLCANPDFICSTDVNWLASIRARLGYALDDILLYGTGGVAFAEIEFANDSPDIGLRGKQTGTEVGFVVGGGAEYAFSDALSVRAEGLYYEFSSIDIDYENDPFVDYEGDVDFFVVRGGLSWHF